MSEHGFWAWTCECGEKSGHAYRTQSRAWMAAMKRGHAPHHFTVQVTP